VGFHPFLYTLALDPVGEEAAEKYDCSECDTDRRNSVVPELVSKKTASKAQNNVYRCPDKDIGPLPPFSTGSAYGHRQGFAFCNGVWPLVVLNLILELHIVVGDPTVT